MKAERERREAILRAEGEKKSTILVAEGKKESAILDAEAEKQAAILTCRGTEGSNRDPRSRRSGRSNLKDSAGKCRWTSFLKRSSTGRMLYYSLRAWKLLQRLRTERQQRLSFHLRYRALQDW